MPHNFTNALPEGTRVAVRYLLGTADPATGARFTDVTGTLVEATEERIVVDSRRGRVVVDRDSVLATRIIPPKASRRGAPHRSLSIEDLQRVMTGAWPPVERESLGDWVLRAADGFTARANSALVVGSPGLPLEQAVEAVRTWYDARALPAQLALPVMTGLPLTEDEVARAAQLAGWTPAERVLVQTAATRRVIAACGSPPSQAPRVRVEVSDQITTDWHRTLASVRVAPRAAAHAVLNGSPAQRFALVRAGAETEAKTEAEAAGVAAISRLGVSDGWGGLGAMWVAPAYRGRGMARAVIGALATEAAALGCVSLHLQVEATNAGAVALYEGLGFSTHHEYAYLTRRSE